MGCIDGLFNNPKEVILRTTEEATDPAGWKEERIVRRATLVEFH